MSSHKHHFFVGTFNTPCIFTLQFDTVSRILTVVARNDEANGGHSWLCFDKTKNNLYATSWSLPPTLAAYSICYDDNSSHPTLKLINTVVVNSRPGYVCCSEKAIYGVGGPSGEVFTRDLQTGGFKSAQPTQKLSFIEATVDPTKVQLRHGAHSVDLSPDNKRLYIADIGRNCIWTFSVNDMDGTIELGSKHIASRDDDGPRHTWPHPNGNYLYCVQEHSSMVDVFQVKSDGINLEHINGVSILPEGKDPKLFWADEVRLSYNNRFLFASNRGLEPQTKGYVLAFMLDSTGLLSKTEPVTIWETPTSGGLANAIEPAPFDDGDLHWLALTDSELGLVMILTFNGEQFEEVARITLPDKAGAATAVWID